MIIYVFDDMCRVDDITKILFCFPCAFPLPLCTPPFAEITKHSIQLVFSSIQVDPLDDIVFISITNEFVVDEVSLEVLPILVKLPLL